MDHKRHATPEGTESFAADADLAEVGYARFGRTGLLVSRVGFGAQRLDDRLPEAADALTAALLSGVNLIDVAPLFGEGRAEAAVGRVLQRLQEAGKLRREQVVLLGKLGLVHGEALAKVREREAAGEVLPEVVRASDEVWHCAHPGFLGEELGRSLQRLGVSALDVALLHDPEHFLLDARRHRKDAPLEEVRAQLDGRLQRAFEQLEAEWEAGRIGWYGVSSGALALPTEEPIALSLTRLLELAQAAARARGRAPESHRFAVVQLPLNLFENAAAIRPQEGAGGRTLLEQARAADLAVLAGRPLNAVVRDRLVRLAEVPEAKAELPLAEAAEEVAALEAIFAQDFAPRVRVEGKGPRPEQLLRWGTELADAPTKLSGLDHWFSLQAKVIGPQTNGALTALAKGFGADPAFGAWQRRYVGALERLLRTVTAELTAAMRERSRKLHAELAGPLPEAWRRASLSRLALGAVLGTPGVTSVLTGMRRRAYVEDALGAIGLPPLAPEQQRALLTALKVRA